MSSTIRVKATDSRIPWLHLLLVAIVTVLAAGCGVTGPDDALVISFNEGNDETTVETVVPAEAPTLALVIN